MSCCCTNVYRLCDLIVCDGEDLVLPIPVPADGEYTMELDFLQDVIKTVASLSLGDNATFPKTNLNERFTYVGRVVDGLGETVTFEINSVVYDCFEFTTKRAV